jgi:type I restriction enzyme R subunit
MSVAGRLARMDRELNAKDRKEIEVASGGKPFKQLITKMFDAFDPDKKIGKAREIFKTDNPTREHVRKAGEELSKIACQPFINPKVRNTIIEIKKRSEQIIDNVTIDELISAGHDSHAKEKSKTIINKFQNFIKDNKDEITALQIIYSKPYRKRHITYEEIKQLAEAIRKPPYLLDTDTLWNAYEILQKSKVRRAGPKRLLTDIISLIRFATGQEQLLEPFAESVDEKFKEWLGKQERLGRKFTKEQLEWLSMIKNHISTSLSIGTDDFELSPFYEKGGAVKIFQLFGNDLNNLMNELNENLIV